MSVINTNIKSLQAQNALTLNNRNLSTAMERLSSGSQINSAKDNAAGLAITSKMTAQIRGLDQAVRNANDAVSIIQTAEGAMIEITNMQQRMRELAIQSANDTNTAEDRGYLDLEFQQLREEIGRIAKNTQWNGMNILDGSFTANNDKGLFKFQVGANQNQTISVKMGDMTAIPGLDSPPNGNVSLKADVSPVKATGAASTDARIIDFTGTEPVKDQTFFVKFGEGDNAAIAEFTATTDKLSDVLTGLKGKIDTLNTKNGDDVARGITATVTGNSLVLTQTVAATADSGPGKETISVESYIQIAKQDTEVPGPTTDKVIKLDGAKLDIDLRGIDVESGQAFQVTLASETYEYIAQPGDDIAKVAEGLAKAINDAAVTDAGTTTTPGFKAQLQATSAGSTLVVQPLPSTETDFKLADKNVSLALAEPDIFVTTGAVPTDPASTIKTATGAQSAIANLDIAIKSVNEERANLGAVINRLTYAADNLANVSMNTSESRSRILDTDYAKTSAELARTQIISQAATAMLAQANQQPQAVLQLLQG